jgi:adenine phosphoribosyltransferase
MEPFETAIRTISDFPKPGIQFKDITPLLADGAVFRATIDNLKERHLGKGIDMVVGIEARGFIFASALAYALGVGTCLVRKPGKLPYTVHRHTYELEYGTDTIEIHSDAFTSGQKIIVVDDVLATGGTVAATVALLREHFDVEIAEIDFVVELRDLEGRSKLPALPIYSLITC